MKDASMMAVCSWQGIEPETKSRLICNAKRYLQNRIMYFQNRFSDGLTTTDCSQEIDKIIHISLQFNSWDFCYAFHTTKPPKSEILRLST